MCGPLLGLVGAAVSGIGSMAAANSQAAVSNRNAQIHEINAITQRQKGAAQADMAEDRNSSLRSSQRVAAAASGVRVGSQSVQRVQQETARDHYMDEMMIIWNAETAANAEENQAKAKRAEAKAQQQAGKISAFSSILGGLKGVATQIN